MIYTVTLNPAVDVVSRIDKIAFGEVNRISDQRVFFGGKGINVSLVLAQLGISSTATGFIAGFTGEAIEKGICKDHLKTDFVKLDSGFSRINIKLSSECETELNAAGPEINKTKLEELAEKLDKLICGDTLVLAGSVPASLQDSVYEMLLSRLDGRGVRFVVDASGKLLAGTLKYKPFLIKPNDRELSEMFGGACIESADDALGYAVRLKEAGAENVLVSMAGKGAVLVDGYGRKHFMEACDGETVNSVGAGDSMVAGFLAGCEVLLDDGSIDYERALMLGTAAGGATAFSDGLAKLDDIMRLFDALQRRRAGEGG